MQCDDLINIAVDQCIFRGIGKGTSGTFQLLLYLVDTSLRDYLPPEVNIPDTGKDNIFE